MANLIDIEDPFDKRVAEYRDIKERDLVKRDGNFIAEGKTVLQSVMNQDRFSLRSALVLDTKLNGMSDLISGIADSVPVYRASSQVFDQIAGFHVHRGVMAIVSNNEIPGPDHILEQAPDAAVALLLSGISNHDNMGGIFRNAAAFGASAILIDGLCCDPLYRKSIRVSVGGVLHVPFSKVNTAEKGLMLLQDHGFEVISLSPSATMDVADMEFSARTAFVLGSEGSGLDASILKLTRPARIRMAGNFDSLNVAASSAIALHRYLSVHQQQPII